MSSIAIPVQEWDDFLRTFSERHRGRTAEIETRDLETAERVVSRSTRLRCVELDTEDEQNPRINVTVDVDNKEIKHIFFRPSQLTLIIAEDDSEEAIQIDSVNTCTRVRFRTPGVETVEEAA